MYKLLSTLVWILFIAGLVILANEAYGRNTQYLTIYLSCLNLYLFGISAYLVLKRVAFQKLRGKVDSIRLINKSTLRINFLWHGILIAIIYLAIVIFYDKLISFNSILIAVILLYYLSQVIMNGNPRLYINEEGIAYDDYFVNNWAWRRMQRIEVDEERMCIVENSRKLELDFSTIDNLDDHYLINEVDSAVLDSELATPNNSQNLIKIVKNYADAYGLKLVTQSNIN